MEGNFLTKLKEAREEVRKFRLEFDGMKEKLEVKSSEQKDIMKDKFQKIEDAVEQAKREIDKAIHEGKNKVAKAELSSTLEIARRESQVIDEINANARQKKIEIEQEKDKALEALARETEKSQRIIDSAMTSAMDSLSRRVQIRISEISRDEEELNRKAKIVQNMVDERVEKLKADLSMEMESATKKYLKKLEKKQRQAEEAIRQMESGRVTDVKEKISELGSALEAAKLDFNKHVVEKTVGQ